MNKRYFFAISLLILISCEAILFEEDISDRAIVILAPLNNSVIENANVNFNWNAVEDALNYQLQVATPNFAEAVQLATDSILPATAFTITLESGEYQWRVRALNENSETIYTTASFTVQPEVFTQDISESLVVLIAPSEGSVIETNPIIFSWEEVAFAENHVLQVATPNFENAQQVVVDELVVGTSLEQTLSNGSYQWRVKAKNSSSETNFTTNNFTVNTGAEFPDREVVIISPPNNFISNQSDVNLQWQAVEEATIYRLQIIDPADNSVVSEQTTASTSLITTFPEGNYSWQIRAENDTQSTQYFLQNITIDSVVPNIPVLLTPTDGEALASTSVNFTWSREAIEGTTESDRIFIYDDAALTNLILQEEVSGGTFTTTLNSNQTYYWKMNAFDEAGNQSGDSDVFSFSIN